MNKFIAKIVVVKIYDKVDVSPVIEMLIIESRKVYWTKNFFNYKITWETPIELMMLVNANIWMNLITNMFIFEVFGSVSIGKKRN